MSPEGIRVSEIDLDLPGACYYLYCETPRPVRIEGLQSMRRAMERLGWKTFAAGNDGCVTRYLFRTSTANLHAGLPVLVGNAVRHHLYLIQPGDPLHRARVFIHCHRRPRLENHSGALPEIRFGLFMGGQDWAEHMLERLARGIREPVSMLNDPHDLARLSQRYEHRREAINEAFRSGRFSLKDIAEHFGMHFSEVSAVINAAGGRPRRPRPR